VGAAPCPRKGGASHPAKVAPQDSRDADSSGARCSVSETRCNGGAFRDRSSHPWPLSFGHPWPNRSLQAPPLPRLLCSGTATGQIHPFRESARTFQFSKEPRDRVCPSRTVFGQGWPKRSAAAAEPCMFNTDEQLRLSTSYRGGRLSLEAVLTDLVCRVAPRLITNLEEYQEAGLAGLRIARSRQYQVRGRGTGGYCGIDVDARGRV